MRISLNIPIYNERDGIEPLYERLVPVLERLGCEFEIIITNDGSTDGSNEVLDALAANDGTFQGSVRIQAKEGMIVGSKDQIGFQRSQLLN